MSSKPALCVVWSPDHAAVEVFVYGRPLAWFDRSEVREANDLWRRANEPGCDQDDYDRYTAFVAAHRTSLARCFQEGKIIGLTPARFETGWAEALDENDGSFRQLAGTPGVDSIDILNSHRFRLNLATAPTKESIAELVAAVAAAFPDTDVDSDEQWRPPFRNPWSEDY